MHKSRERFIHQIFTLFIIVGFLAYVPSVYFAVLHNLWPIAIVDTIVYGSIFGIFFSRKFSYYFRTSYFLLMVYLIGTALLFTVRAEYALIWFFSVPVLAAILLGLRAAIITLLVNLLILVGSAVLIYKGIIFWSIDVGNADMLTGWFIISINFMLLNTIASITAAVLLERLYDSINQQKVSNKMLEQQREKLKAEIKIRENTERENSAITEKLQQAQKMEAIGMMASGVAHDLNNILSGIVNYPELMLLKLPDDSPLRKHLESMKKAGIRAADVVSDLLTVARGAASVKTTQNLNKLVAEYLDSPEIKQLQLTHPLVELKLKQDKNTILNAECSPIHIQKSLMNLIINAFESINERGLVEIELQNKSIEPSSPQTAGIPAGHYVLLSVLDSGDGIPEQDLQRIFEPFFTKKVMGQSGTGLGLAVVWNTIQDHKGYIRVSSDNSGHVLSCIYMPLYTLHLCQTLRRRQVCLKERVKAFWLLTMTLISVILQKIYCPVPTTMSLLCHRVKKR